MVSILIYKINLFAIIFVKQMYLVVPYEMIDSMKYKDYKIYKIICISIESKVFKTKLYLNTVLMNHKHLKNDKAEIAVAIICNL